MPFIMCPQCILIFVLIHSPPVILTFLIFLKFTRQTYTCSRVFFPVWLSGKESACQCWRHKKYGFNPCVRKMSQSRKWQPAPIFLPEKFHGQRNLVGYSPWSHKELDRTEDACMCACTCTQTHTDTHTHRSLSPIFPPCLEHC